jgi:lysophospholipase L1-like esterase
MPECATYDETLTYTLRPGRCTFANREFITEYAINALGVRDDEQSMDQPRVVALGDSVTMGWGVEQHEAFPSVFERMTGWRTLNAGVSSYGTVRELRMLQRIDRRNLTHVLIQYSGNDVVENEQLAAVASELASRITSEPCMHRPR